MNKKYIVIGAIVLALLVGITVGVMVGGNESQPLGRAANRLPNGYWDTADGYYVDGTEVINNDGSCISLNGLYMAPVSTGTAEWATGNCP